MITEKVKNNIEFIFTRRMIVNRVEYKSEEFYKRQSDFFGGVLTALTLDECPQSWFEACNKTNVVAIPEYKL